jgi:hypothetical protein
MGMGGHDWRIGIKKLKNKKTSGKYRPFIGDSIEPILAGIRVSHLAANTGKMDSIFYSIYRL